MKIKKNVLARISVRMFDLQGNLLEQTDDDGVTYLHGHDDIFARIEQALEGKEPGDRIEVTLEPEDAFGDFDPQAIRIVDVPQLGDPELVVPGLLFDAVPGELPDGRRWRVSEVAEGKVVLDANHPLAGWGLRFVVNVLEVSAARGETTGNDDVVVPGFLGFAQKIIDDEIPDEEPEGAQPL